MASIPQCQESHGWSEGPEHALLCPDLTCTMLPKHTGLHVDPSGVLWAPQTQEGYRRATEMG